MISIHAPTRIDLAGGTLDISPLPQFAFPEVFATLNVAIDIQNKVTITSLNSKKIRIESKDLEIIAEFENAHHLKSEINKNEHPLLLVMKAILFFQTEGIFITISSEAPRGSGLGNSSSLIIAVISGLNQFASTNFTKLELLKIAQGLETSVLKIPTGSQDYIAAMYGGVNFIKYELKNTAIINLLESKREQSKERRFEPTIVDKLVENSILCYTGTPQRFSNPLENPNWDVFSRVVEAKGNTFHHLREINTNVYEMVEAIQNSNWDKFIQCINLENALRTNLSSQIVTKKMQQLITFLQDQKAENTVVGYKICGAGGGGCMLIITNGNAKQNIITKLNEMKLQNYKLNIDHDGVTIQDK